MKYILVAIIHLYQLLPGSWHSSCKYIPTCSNYGIEAITKYGSLKGGFLTIKRIIKCNPFSKGGFDPVKEKGVKK